MTELEEVFSAYNELDFHRQFRWYFVCGSFPNYLVNKIVDKGPGSNSNTRVYEISCIQTRDRKNSVEDLREELFRYSVFSISLFDEHGQSDEKNKWHFKVKKILHSTPFEVLDHISEEITVGKVAVEAEYLT